MTYVTNNTGGRDSSVSITACYRLGGPGIEAWCGRDFLHLFRMALGPTQPPIKWVLGHSRGIKWPGCGAGHPPPSSAEVKERVEIYLFVAFPG